VPVVDSHIAEHVEEGTSIYTDALMSYMGLNEKFQHDVIDHASKYVKGQVHTNGLENFWSLLKRSLKGTYISIEPFHMFRYLDEQAWRYNNRATKEQFIGDGDRFRTALAQIVGKRLTFKEVTGKVGKERLRLCAYHVGSGAPLRSTLLFQFLHFDQRHLRQPLDGLFELVELSGSFRFRIHLSVKRGRGAEKSQSRESSGPI
jgi:transposase-like protein